MVRLFVLLGMVVAAPALAEPVGVPLRESVPHMMTTGEAFADVAPDQADLRLAVEQERPSADEAADATAKAAAAVVAAIEAHGVAPARIKTTFSLVETFLETKNEHGVVTSRAHRGYKVREPIVVHVDEIAKIGALARDLIGKGADLFEGVSFSSSKEKARRRELRAEALRDAYLTAKASVDAVGLKLDRVLEIGEAPMDHPQSMRFAGSSTPDSPAPATAIPLEPGMQRLVERVAVVWQIEGTAR